MEHNQWAKVRGRGVGLPGAALVAVLVCACGVKTSATSEAQRRSLSPAQGGDSQVATGGSDDGVAGSLSLIVTDDAGDTGGSTGTVEMLPPGTLPPDFTKTDVGGFKLGAQIQTVDAGVDAGASSGGSGGASSSLCGTTILAVVRDFKADGMTFEGSTIGDDRMVVLPTLGADRKPVYAKSGASNTIASPAVFNEFFHDTDGVNIPFLLYMFFAPSNGVTSFQSTAYFPLDGQGWGNDGNDDQGVMHNFHFTTEIHTEFKYNGGETFNFTGDDDVWAFINNQLVIDLGGVHSAETASVSLDAQAATLGLTIGSVYPFDMFQTERHTTGSNFRADTDLAFVDCGTIVPDQPPK